MLKGFTNGSPCKAMVASYLGVRLLKKCSVAYRSCSLLIKNSCVHRGSVNSKVSGSIPRKQQLRWPLTKSPMTGERKKMMMMAFNIFSRSSIRIWFPGIGGKFRTGVHFAKSFAEIQIMISRRGLHSTEVAYLLLTQQPWVRFPVFPNSFSEEKLSILLRIINCPG